MHLEIDYPDAERDLNRWLPLVKWLQAIPHYIVLIFLAFGAGRSARNTVQDSIRVADADHDADDLRPPAIAPHQGTRTAPPRPETIRIAMNA